MATQNIKFAGEDAVNALATEINKKLTKVSSMPGSPDLNMTVLYVGATSSSYVQGNIYQWDGTQWNLLNSIWGNIQGNIENQTDLMNKLNTKQDTLTFDNFPIQNSNNPVKSNGIYESIKGTDKIVDDTVGFIKKNKFQLYPQSTLDNQTINGVSFYFTRNSEGQVTKILISGSSTDTSQDISIAIGQPNLANGDYILSGGIDEKIYLQLQDDLSFGRVIATDKGDSPSFNISMGDYAFGYLIVKGDAGYIYTSVYPMIRDIGIASDAFYPYYAGKTVKEITGNLDNLQTTTKTDLVSAINEIVNIQTPKIPVDPVPEPTDQGSIWITTA